MGDLKPLWPDKDLPLATVGLAGDTVVSSGTDPNARGNDGPAALKDFWQAGGREDNRSAPATSDGSIEETRNSVSGLPALPNRFEPAEAKVEPPDLTDRNPGNVDRK